MIRFDPESYYSEESLRIMGWDGEALRRARKSEGLRFKKVGRSVVYKGEWLMEWLDRAAETEASTA